VQAYLSGIISRSIAQRSVLHICLRRNSIYLSPRLNHRTAVLESWELIDTRSTRHFMVVYYFVFAGCLSVRYSKFGPALPSGISACLVEGHLGFPRSCWELVDKLSSSGQEQKCSLHCFTQSLLTMGNAAATAQKPKPAPAQPPTHQHPTAPRFCPVVLSRVVLIHLVTACVLI